MQWRKLMVRADVKIYALDFKANHSLTMHQVLPVMTLM